MSLIQKANSNQKLIIFAPMVDHIKIGNIDLGKIPLILAPMEGVSEPPFRLLCKKMGADLVYSEFVSSDGLIRDVKKTVQKLEIIEEERPLAIQIYGHDEESLKRATEMVTERKPDIIDINCGCPVRKVVRRGAGAALLKEPDKMVKIASSIVKSTNLPVTLKTRLGWDQSTIDIVNLTERLQDVGIQAIALHGRTGVQLYRGEADWTYFPKIKENQRFKIPLFGNGDVKNVEDAVRMKEDFFVDGVMIGRATTGNPFIFREIKYYLENQKKIEPASTAERIETCKTHLTESLKRKREMTAIHELRQHYGPYFSGYPNFKNFRLRLVNSKDVNEIFEIFEEIRITYPDN